MKIIQALLFTLFFQQSYGQPAFMLKAGFNYVTNVATKNGDLRNGLEGENEYRMSYHIGIAFQPQPSGKLGLVPEILFSSKGFKATNDLGRSTVFLSYINLPILLNYQITQNFSVQLGPEIGYLLAAKSKNESGTVNIKSAWDNEFDLGLSLGMTYKLLGNLSSQLRYTYGLTSVIQGGVIISDIDEQGNISETQVNFQNRTFQLSILYSFFNKKPEK